MMVSLGVYVRRWQRVVRRWLLDPRVHTLAQAVGYLLLGFIFSAASLGSCFLPLALGALCAASGVPAVLLAAGSMAGFFVFWGVSGAQGVVWIMGGVLASALLGGRPVSQKAPLLMPALAGFLVAVVGLGFQIWLKDETPVAVYLLRVILAIVSTGVFALANRRKDPILQWLVGGFLVLSLAQITVSPYVGLGYVAAALLSCAGAFPAAALAGLALDLAQITPVPMTAVMCLCYFVRFLPFGKKWVYYCAPGAVYLLVMRLCGYWDVLPLAGLILGGAAAVLVPGRPGLTHRRGETGAAQVRLEMASGVMRQTGELLKMEDEIPIDEQALIGRAIERACGSCPYRKQCKPVQKEITPALLHRPLGNGEGLPKGCRKKGRLSQELRRSQEQLRGIRADRDRRREYRSAIVQQYGFLSRYLQEVSDSLAARKHPPEAWYAPEVAVCSAGRQRVNGDKCWCFAGVECRYYILLCDGMGTGEAAAWEGKKIGNMLRKLLMAGYPAAYALRTVNSLCALQGNAGVVTIDLAEVQLDTGKATLYKWGAAPSYFISRGEIVKVGTATPPPGLSVTDCRETVEKLSLRRGETLVLLSDGAGGEEALRIGWEHAWEPARVLAARILRAGAGNHSDDATVAVIRLGATPLE